MNGFEYHLVENELTAKDFIRLKVATGFRERSIEQVEKALNNNLFDVTAVYNDEVIGMGKQLEKLEVVSELWMKKRMGE